jgi:photosystem II stability/assembly factor-like uncharacterized protein
MQTLKYPFILAALVLIFSSCKKNKEEWKKVEKLETHTTDRLNAILFLNDKVGFVVGGQRFQQTTILTTRDGGQSWDVTTHPEAGKALYGITTNEYGHVYTCGFSGNLLETTDTGKSWKFSQISTWESQKDIAFVDPGVLIIIGGISFQYGFISYVNSQKQVFRFDSLGYELNDIHMLNNRVGYITGYGVVLKTTNGGVSWEMLDIQNDNFKAISAINENEAWVCGKNGSIFHTSNGGSSWEKQRNGNSVAKKKYHLLDILFTDSNNGWACGESGVIIYTNDGGSNWKEYEHFTDAHLQSIAKMPDGNLITAGDDGTVYKLHIK